MNVKLDQHMTFTISNIFEDVLSVKESSIFLNEQVFSPDLLPQNFPHRSEQLKQMIRYFKGFFKNPDNQSIPFFRQTILLQGDVGSGKTSIAKRFGMEFETLAHRKYPYLNVKYRHLNCRRNRTVYTILVHLIQSLIPYFPNRGFSPAELLRLLETHLFETNTYLLLTLDEIDSLLQDSEFQNLLYSLTRLNDELLMSGNESGKRISLILITRNANLLNLLDHSARSGIAKNIISFPKYSQDQMKDILQERVAQGFQIGVVTNSALDVITQLASSSGDARFAIELLLRSGRNTETENQDKLIPEHVHMAQTSVYPVSKELIKDLSIEHKLFLFTIAKWFTKNPSQQTIKLNDIRKYLPIYADQFNIKKFGKGNTSMWLYMKSLASWGLIQKKVVSTGSRGRMTQITLDIPPNLIINELEETLQSLTT